MVSGSALRPRLSLIVTAAALLSCSSMLSTEAPMQSFETEHTSISPPESPNFSPDSPTALDFSTRSPPKSLDGTQNSRDRNKIRRRQEISKASERTLSTTPTSSAISTSSNPLPTSNPIVNAFIETIFSTTVVFVTPPASRSTTIITQSSTSISSAGDTITSTRTTTRTVTTTSTPICAPPQQVPVIAPPDWSILMAHGATTLSAPDTSLDPSVLQSRFSAHLPSSLSLPSPLQESFTSNPGDAINSVFQACLNTLGCGPGKCNTIALFFDTDSDEINNGWWCQGAFASGFANELFLEARVNPFVTGGESAGAGIVEGWAFEKRIRSEL